MKYIAIIEGKDVCIVKWNKTYDAADKFIANWLNDNRTTRPYVRTTIAESLYVIEG